MINNRQVLFNYGLLGGIIVAVSFFLSGFVLGTDPAEMNFDHGRLLGYATMVLALTTVFFGIKSYRDRHRNGLISFKDAFMSGMIVVLVASILYVVGWMIYYPNFMPDFADEYLEFQKQVLTEKGISGEAFQREVSRLESFNDMYKNPWVMAGITFMEIFPVGLIVAIISAWILRRKSFQDDNLVP